MNHRGGWRWALIGLVALRLAAAAAPVEDEHRWSGPLRWLSAHPFDGIFLDQQPLDGALPRKPVFGFSISHFNTMSLSPNVLGTPAGQALQANSAAHQPQTLLNIPSLLATARATPGEFYYFADTETTRLDFRYTRPVGRQWGWQAEVPVWGHVGGFFDETIEGFHDVFNFPKLNRDLAPHNRVQLVVAHGNDSRAYTGPFEPSLGDIVIRGFHAPLLESPSCPALMLSASVKLPTGPASRFLGSGRWDWGGAVHVAKSLGDFRVNTTVGHTWHGGWSGLPSISTHPTWDVLFGGEYRISNKWTTTMQFAWREHTLKAAAPGLFATPAWTMGVGFSCRAEKSLWLDGAFLENLSAKSRSYDVGLQYQMRWLQ